MNRTLDSKGRWRNKVVAFRMSEAENTELDTYVQLSGLTKQEYIIRRLLQKEITVLPNPRIHKALRNQMADILDALHNQAVGDEVMETIRFIATMLGDMKQTGED